MLKMLMVCASIFEHLPIGVSAGKRAQGGGSSDANAEERSRMVHQVEYIVILGNDKLQMTNCE